MTHTPLKDIDEALVERNRELYKAELSQGIFEAMEREGVTRSQLAELMGFASKSRVTHILSGEENLGAETLADILLVLGRSPHLVMGTDVGEMRLPVDEGTTGASEGSDGKAGKANKDKDEHSGGTAVYVWLWHAFRKEAAIRLASGSGATGLVGGQHGNITQIAVTGSNDSLLSDYARWPNRGRKAVRGFLAHAPHRRKAGGNVQRDRKAG
ncbi:MAG: helix-turn-helix transcriptional regulator [Phycisphaerales bacterium]|nr:helix-turn-helix transcriptional regulator [Phycisphaerales bacterium]